MLFVASPSLYLKGTIMSEIKTLAFIINEANYSLAVATLPPRFALIPTNKVYGDIVVLNDLFAMNTEHR